MISIKNISKSYGETKALDNISLEVAKGELFGLIGPDGAGKSTLFRILTTLLLADEGTATVADCDVVKDYRKIRKQVGYMPGRFSLYQDLSVYENLEFFATIFGTTIEENYDLIRDIYVQIEPFKTRRASKLSGGMKQKLALCCALIHSPRVLFLDEPTTGVDPVSRKEFWEILKKLKAKGITILVSTPYMDEASLCEKIALIQHGKILSVDTPENIIRQYAQKLWKISASHIYSLIKDLEQFSKTHSVFAFGDGVHLSSDDATLQTAEIEHYLSEKKHQNLEVTPIQANIEDCFMELMQQEG